VEAGVLGDKEDVFYLTFQELHDVVRTNEVDDELIRQRKDAFQSYERSRRPGCSRRTARHRRRVPARRRAGRCAGRPAGLGRDRRGRARVILDMAEADVEPGDILVTTYTDPSWSPLFVAITGLVTEVGGLMTHGA
jgi:pyruvate,water dikinase